MNICIHLSTLNVYVLEHVRSAHSKHTHTQIGIMCVPMVSMVPTYNTSKQTNIASIGKVTLLAVSGTCMENV